VSCSFIGPTYQLYGKRKMRNMGENKGLLRLRVQEKEIRVLHPFKAK
jgi:hypothetical protein